MNKKYISILFLAILFMGFATACSSKLTNDNVAQTPKNGYRYLIEVDGKYGFINQKGVVVIEPQFDDAKVFSEGLAAVKINGKWGYINKTGKVIVEPQFENAYDFSDGLAFVAKGSIFIKYCIDKTGRIVIDDPQYEFTTPWFKDGLALAFFFKKGQSSSDNVIFINKKGEIKLDLKDFDYYNCDMELLCQNFSEGLLPIYNRKLFLSNRIMKWGFIDKKANTIVEPQYEWVREFSEGLAAVEINDKWGYIDKAGKVVIKPQYSDAYTFSEGLAVITKPFTISNGNILNKNGYINKQGEIIVKPQYDMAYPFSDGLGLVTDGYKNERKTIYVMLDGKPYLTFKNEFDEMYPFINGLALVKLHNGVEGYINKKGELIWQGSKSSYNIHERISSKWSIEQ